MAKKEEVPCPAPAKRADWDHGLEEGVAKSHEAGFVHHLTKPVRLEKLSALPAGRTPAEKVEPGP